jgi:hypothetical protein
MGEKITVGLIEFFTLVLIFFFLRWLLKKEFRRCRERREAQRRRFLELKPLTDEEFLKLLAPGTTPEVALKVKNIISYSCGADPALVRPDMPLADLDLL